MPDRLKAHSNNRYTPDIHPVEGGLYSILILYPTGKFTSTIHPLGRDH